VGVTSRIDGTTADFDEGQRVSRLLSSPDRERLLPGVTDTELKILAGLAAGRTYAEIAGRLGFRPKTVKNKGLVLLKKISPRRRRIEAVSRLVELAHSNVPTAELERVQQVLSDAVLSGRELRLLELMATGHSINEVALALGLRGKSVKNHVSNIVQKLEVPNRTAAAVLWLLAAGPSEDCFEK